MDKITLIYDISALYDGFYKTSSRSGIYFCVINLLKELVLNEDIDLSLYCMDKNLPETMSVLKKEFPNKDFDLIADTPMTKQNLYFLYLKHLRRRVKDEEKIILKRFIIKTILKFIILALTPINALLKKIALKLIKQEKYTSDTFFLSPAYPIPDIFANCKKFTILHDTIPLILPDKAAKGLEDSWYAKLLSSLNHDDYYFANSECTRKDFLKYFPQIDSKKIHPVLHACGKHFVSANSEQIKNVRDKYNIPAGKKYIFSLCTLEPRKNLIRTVKTFIQFIKKHNIDDLYFVLGGGNWEMFISQLEKEIDNLGEYKNKIIKTGYIDDQDLPPLYSCAEWFVYTSQYEGFGVPPLEAMSCACPVIVSNNSSLPEVVGDAGQQISWDSDEEHIEAYEKYYFDSAFRNLCARKGYERSKNFSWEKCANRMLEIMENANIETKINDFQKQEVKV